MSQEIIFERYWAMPNSNTYEIKPIKEMLEKEVHGFSLDPFAKNSQICTWNNDINGLTDAELSHDALEFLKCEESENVDCLLFDPPYSPRQVSECYKAVGLEVSNLQTSAKFWASLKDEIARITHKGSKVISFGWNSCGIGKTRGFEIRKIIMISHGGNHNDTIITIEEKIKDDEFTGVFKCQSVEFRDCTALIVEIKHESK